MTKRVERNGLQVDAQLAVFLDEQALPGKRCGAGGFLGGIL